MPYITTRLVEVVSEYVKVGLSIVVPEDSELIIPREMAIQYTVSAFIGVIVWWIKNDMSYSPKYMAKNLMRVAIQGPYVNNLI